MVQVGSVPSPRFSGSVVAKMSIAQMVDVAKTANLTGNEVTPVFNASAKGTHYYLFSGPSAAFNDKVLNAVKAFC